MEFQFLGTSAGTPTRARNVSGLALRAPGAKGWVLVDAGWMAMSRDRGTQAQEHDYGYGAVCDEAGRLIEGLVMGGANQEHGILSWADGRIDESLEQRFPVGSRLRILPNHACATAAQFDHYQVLMDDGSVQRWNRFGGW